MLRLARPRSVLPLAAKGPSRLNAVAFAKWQEWDAKRGLAIEGARAQYVEMVERLVQKQR